MFYLFPYGRVSGGSSIAIYGSGEIGLSYLEQMKATGYCNVVCVADQQIIQSQLKESAQFVPANELSKYNFDTVVIASQKYNDEIYSSLLKAGINPSSIISFSSNEIILTTNHLRTPASFNWNNYYQHAESSAQYQFEHYIKPVLERYRSAICLTRVLDFACGKGRMAVSFVDISDSVVCADISTESIEHCKSRFSNKANVTYIVSEAHRISVEDSSISFLYSWDAMVHFRYKDLDVLLGEFFRVMSPGAFAFVHHSNLAALSLPEASEDWSLNPHFRSNVELADMARLALRHGFQIIEQSELDWSIPRLDGITVLRKDE